MAASDVTTLAGTIQKYFEKEWMDRPQEEFLTPLCNNSALDTATIPKNKGQYVEIRKFDHFAPTGDGTDDSPKTYAENSEPSTPLTQSASIIQIPFELLRDYVDMGAVQVATDPVDLMIKMKEEMFTYIRRMCHRLTNGHMVKQITRVLSSSAVPPATTYLPEGFKAMMVNGKSAFADLNADDVYTMMDFKRARLLLANVGVPKFANGRYKAVIDEAILAQLQEDPAFADMYKRHEALAKEIGRDGKLFSWQGFDWILQNDEYRCHLPDAGGALTTRADAGQVHVAHVFGPHAAGYVPFGGSNSLNRTTMKPKFKVQDISVTGTNVTVGYTLPYQAAVFDRRRGLNIAGCTRFDETIDDLV